MRAQVVELRPAPVDVGPPAIGALWTDRETCDMPRSLIMPASDNVRSHLGDLTELVASVREKGILQRVVVTPAHAPELGRDRPGDAGRVIVVMGHRRFASAEIVELAEVPVEIRLVNERERLDLMFVENYQRNALTPLDEARAFERMVERGDSQHEIARRLGVSQGHVSKRLALLELPGAAVAQLDSGGITIGQALELLKLKDHPTRLKRALNPPKYQSLEQAVASELGAIESERKVAEVKRDYETAGKKVVLSIAAQSWEWKGPKGTFELEPKGNCYVRYPAQTLLVDPKAHEREPCHAIGLCLDGRTTVELCTDRKRHPAAMTVEERQKKNAAKNDAKRDAEEEKREEKALEAKASAQFIEHNLVKRLGVSAQGLASDKLKAELIRAVLRERLLSSSLSLLVRVGDRLGAPKCKEPSAPAWGPERDKVVDALIDRIADQVGHREVSALHALMIETLLAGAEVQEFDPALLRVLKLAGHKLGKHELAALERDDRERAKKTTEGGGGKAGRAKTARARPAPTSKKRGA